MYSDPGDQNTRPIYGCTDPGHTDFIGGDNDPGDTCTDPGYVYLVVM